MFVLAIDDFAFFHDFMHEAYEVKYPARGGDEFFHAKTSKMEEPEVLVPVPGRINSTRHSESVKITGSVG